MINDSLDIYVFGSVPFSLSTDYFKNNSIKNLLNKYKAHNNYISDLTPIRLEEELDKLLPNWSSESEIDELNKYLNFFKLVAEKLPYYNSFVFHSAAVYFRDEAYLFAAPSGTGKTTHVALWKKYLGNNIGIINGDKPILTYNKELNNISVNGSPWCGKEYWNTNISKQLKGICFLSRADHSSIIELEPTDSLTYAFRQVYLPRSPEAVALTMELTNIMLNSVQLYELKCDISDEAVRTSFEKLTGCSFDRYSITI